MKNWSAIFDWDGVVVDSSRQHLKSWQALADEIGCVLRPEDFRRSFGMKNNRIIPEIYGWASDPDKVQQLSLRKEVHFRKIVQSEGIEPLPGVAEWLDALKSEKISCAVASSTDRANIECILEIIGLQHYFQALVCSEDVQHGKPHPEVFLSAAQRLKAEPLKCVVFEDAHVGIEAARAAHMKVIAVTTTHPAQTLSNADLVIDRLDELTVRAVSAWF